MGESFLFDPSESNVTICLNMIVKNEESIIQRLLESVLPLIDSYCICDTGSTDNTARIIYQFFEKHQIPGKIMVEPFRDFEYNRTYALKQCRGMSKADYLLLIDADMVLKLPTHFSAEQFKTNLKLEAYYMIQGSDQFCYQNVRIIKNHPDLEYKGVTHEYLKLPPHFRTGSIEENQMTILDIGDGGSKADKFNRDIRLLVKGLESEPKNDRYMFYLANSYRDTGQYDNAIAMYLHRIEMGGWNQEVWYSYFSIGNCYRMMEDMETAIYYWLEAYQYYPARIENLYEIITYYRKLSKYHLANIYWQIANPNRAPAIDALFLQKDVYEYKLDYEYSIIGYYVNPDDHNTGKYSMKVLATKRVPDNIIKSVLINYKFYCPRLPAIRFELPLNTNLIQDTSFISSTPSLCITKYGELVVNIRYVNYQIDPKGTYVTGPTIESKNIIMILTMDTNTKQWQKRSEFILDHDHTIDNAPYIGIEDIRLFVDETDNIVYNANKPVANVEHGLIDFRNKRTVNSRLLTISDQRPIEKNWTMCLSCKKETMFVYSWYPLTVGQRKNSEIVITHQLPTPPFFKWVRGSTNGISMSNNEIWFICHLVSYEEQRYYYHMFVILDGRTMECKQYSRLFTFEKEKVEYTLGFVFFEETHEFMIGYSTMDRTTRFIKTTKTDIELLFVL